MNVETGTEATQFPEKEYINGIFLAVMDRLVTVGLVRLSLSGMLLRVSIGKVL
jgi:hypothetical protein